MISNTRRDDSYMRKEDVENLKLKDLKHVLTPLKRGRVLKDYVDIGFDTEFTAEDDSAERELLSLQFSLGRGRSSIYYVNKRAGVSSRELLDYALRFLSEQSVEPRKHIFLIAHFAIAELSKISDFYDEYMTHDGVMMRPKVSEFNKAINWQRRFDDVTLLFTLAQNHQFRLWKLLENHGHCLNEVLDAFHPRQPSKKKNHVPVRRDSPLLPELLHIFISALLRIILVRVHAIPHYTYL